jgi:spore coat polysaccharide biosynthesis protein SpsF
VSSSAPVVAIIQARMGSTRLPGKILKPLAGRPSLAWIVERTRAIAGVDSVIVATTDRPGDDAVETLAREAGWRCFRGSEPDVLDRYYRAAIEGGARHVVRVTADCPLLCVSEAGRTVAHHLAVAADYTHNVTVWGSGLPIGTGVEVMTFAALEASWREGHEPHHREHVDEFVYEHPERFRLECVKAPPELTRPELRLTVDTPEDFALVGTLYERLSRPGHLIDLAEVIALLDAEPALVAINRDIQQRIR